MAPASLDPPDRAAVPARAAPTHATAPIPLAAPGRVIAPPASRRLKAGVVVLAPGEAVGTHRTHGREELIIALEGQGVLVTPDGEQRFGGGEALYVPPETDHDVRNVGEGKLRYCYVVALLDQAPVDGGEAQPGHHTHG